MLESQHQPAAVAPEPTTGDPVLDALRRGVARLVERQGPDGAWRGDYSGPLFLLPLYVAACHIGGHPVPARRRDGMVAHLRGAQNRDGSLGLHVEAPGAMFTTALGYVALRLLGEAPDDPALERMRSWIHAHGTPLASAPWGKIGLAVLNLYDYDGLHPIPPELWLLPPAVPFHPSRLWCHCRQVYLPMAYLYGSRARQPVDDLTVALRRELYDRPYEEIPFRAHRDTAAPSDCLIPPTPLQRVTNRGLALLESLHGWRLGLRARALADLLDHIDYEDRTTDFVRIGPVNAVLNTLVHCFRDPGSASVRRSFAALDDYLWEEGREVRMGGYNSTALWDTAFATRAILASPLAGEQAAALARAHGYIRDHQVLEDVPDRHRFHRHASRGGWPFSDRRHGWPISDCTAEGLSCALLLEEAVAEPVPEELLWAAVELLLSWQNPDGGWATYERQRGGRWLEQLNPSQVFAQIMVDYPCVECTSACMQALARALVRFPGRRDADLNHALVAGEDFLRRAQRPDGSFEGSWAVCFTYGTWFGVSGLRAAGVAGSDEALRRACDFLARHQRPDGGYGEHWESCRRRSYVPAPDGHAVQTAWALLALVRAGQAHSPAARAAATFLLRRQRADGTWPEEPLVGVFNRTALLNYDNYRRYFPVWALAEHATACAS